MAADSPSIRLVRSYIEAAQRARASGSADDLDAVRRFLADDVVMKTASPWSDEPWQVRLRGVDAVIERFQAPINAATSLTTETCSRLVTTYSSNSCPPSSTTKARTSASCATSSRWQTA